MTQENWVDNGVKSNYVKFNKIGDFIRGTLVHIETPDKPDKFGKMNRKFTVKAVEGTWHDTEMQSTEAAAGKEYKLTSKPSIDFQMADTLVGQKIKFTFTENKKGSNGNPQKIITVSQPRDGEGRIVIDPEFVPVKPDELAEEAGF